MRGLVRSLTAETLSLLAGLELFVNQEVSSLVVKLDPKVLVHLVCSDILSKWPLCNMLQVIIHYLSRLNGSSFHVFREANYVADALASLQLGEQ